MFAENCMRNSVLLLVAISALSLPVACGGKLTDAETRETTLPDGAIIGKGGSDNTGGSGGSDSTGGSGGSSSTGGGSDPGSGGTTGTGGATSGTGGSTTGTGATGGSGGGSGGSGGVTIDAGSACPVTQPSNGADCGTSAGPCSYGNTTCACAMTGGGGGGNRRDAGMSWTCGGGTVDAGRRG